MKNKQLFLGFVSCLLTSAVFAKKDTTVINLGSLKPIMPKFYVGNALDGAIFSSAFIRHDVALPGAPNSDVKNSIGILRFSFILNIGATFNYNINEHLGLYTGIDIKNIGFIENGGGYTAKRRTYNIGMPLGVKIGSMEPNRFYAFFGGGVDAPFNYKEKRFSARNEKTKLYEWFSDRTPKYMPYVFAGAGFERGVTLKLQYYLNNFMNPDFTDNAGYKPYLGFDVHIIMLSIGVNIHFTKRDDEEKRRAAQLDTI